MPENDTVEDEWRPNITNQIDHVDGFAAIPIAKEKMPDNYERPSFC